MFGFVFDGHPDLRPLLTEEGLGYYVLRKTHPLAEIEEWQEDYAKAAEAGAPPGERARKREMGQKKAAIRRKAREEARAKGLSAEEEKVAVQAAVKAFEEQAAALVKKARQEARARGASPEEESRAVVDALKELAAEEKGGE